MNDSVLLVEDEEALRMTVGDRLRNRGYKVDCAEDGDEALDRAGKIPYDLIILDIMLPRRDGFAVCRDIRAAGLITPILMLTARTRTKDKVYGFRIGADDYLTKPFDIRELLARIGALLRRAPTRSAAPGRVLRLGSVQIDLGATELERDGRSLDVSAREFQLLRYLIEHAGTTVSRDELLREVWGYNTGTFTRTVDVHVSSLRQKIEEDPRQPRIILTVPGLGYKLKLLLPTQLEHSPIDS